MNNFNRFALVAFGTAIGMFLWWFSVAFVSGNWNWIPDIMRWYVDGIGEKVGRAILLAFGTGCATIGTLAGLALGAVMIPVGKDGK